MISDQSKNTSVTGSIKSMKVMHLALLSGQVIFGLITYFLSETNHFEFNFSDPFFILVSLFAISGPAIGNFIFNQKIDLLNKKESLKERISAYQSALITKYALIESPSLFGIIAYLLYGNLYYLLVSALLVLYFLTLAPNEQKMNIDLKVSSESISGYSK